MNGLAATIFLYLICSAKAYIEYDGWANLELLHNIGVGTEETFKYRANVTISSLNSGLSNIVQETLSTSDLQAMKDIAHQNGFYRVKAYMYYPNGLRRTFTTGVRASSLLRAVFNDEIRIAIDGSGYINAITLSTSSSSSDFSSDNFSLLSEQEFNTDVLVKHTELAPVPDTASFIQKIEREREARDRGDVKDTRGFLAKYWIYVVPVVILVFISGATNNEQK